MSPRCSFRLSVAVVLSLAGCVGLKRPVMAPAPRLQGDLLEAAREWTMTEGRAAARDRLERSLAEFDDQGGWLERRLEAANADKTLVFDDSMARMSPVERRRTGILFVLGYNHNQGRSPLIIWRAAQRLSEQGFHAVVMNSPARLTADESAIRVTAWLAAELPQVDRALVIGFSRGATDLAHFFLEHTERLPERELRKIGAWMNIAGALRGSAVAQWAAYGPGLDAAVFRGLLNWREVRPFQSFADLASISDDPWTAPGHQLPAKLRGLRVINLVVLPDGPDGWPTTDWLFSLLGRRAAVRDPRLGPCDGLVESAAAVLPAGTGFRQWVVRVRGSHAVLDGYYLSGGRVTAGWTQGPGPRLESGGELMDDLLRALPRSTVGAE